MIDIKEISQISDISQLVILFGSNFDSENVWSITKSHLKNMGECYFSDITISPDYTKKTNLIYYNACILIQLNCLQHHQQLNSELKKIEIQCGRNRLQNNQLQINQVTISQVKADLDILAVYTKNWHISQRRLPFKEHERIGLLQIAPFLLNDI